MRKQFAFALLLSSVLASACGSNSSSSSSTTVTTPTTPTATNRAPTVTSMSMTPSFGIAQLTQFSFSASGSDPDGDAITYAWDVAGNPFSGSSGTVTFSNGFNGIAKVTVTDSKGATGSDTRSFVVGSMTGNWSFLYPTRARCCSR